MIYTTAEQRVKKAGEVCAWAKNYCYGHGDSHSLPPGKDHWISCDRLCARMEYEFGNTDQQMGGFTVFTAEQYLTAHGAAKITDKTKVKKGDYILMKVVGQSRPTEFWHMFVMATDYNNGVISKYDLGSTERIKAGGYFQNVAFNEWTGYREFYCAFRMPSTPNKKEETHKKILPAVYLNKKGSAVRLLQKLLLYANCRGKDGQPLKVDGVCGVNTVHAINVYQDRKRRRGVELGTDGKNDGICGEKMWKSMIG